MKTLTIELLNEKAEILLEDLVALDLIKIVKNSTNIKPPTNNNKKPSDFFGLLTTEEGSQILNFVNESRDEWERDI
jgi:hypothetical protein